MLYLTWDYTVTYQLFSWDLYSWQLLWRLVVCWSAYVTLLIAANSIFERIREIVFIKVNDSNIEQQQMFEQKIYSIAKV